MGWGRVRWEQYQQGAELEGKKLHTGTGREPGEKCGWGRQGSPRTWALSSPASLALAYIHWDLVPALTKGPARRPA